MMISCETGCDVFLDVVPEMISNQNDIGKDHWNVIR